MQELIVILTAVLVIIGAVTIIIMLKQSKDKNREAEITELKATLQPVIKLSFMHGVDGLNIIFEITGRSEVPIKLQKITLQTWNRNNPEKKYLTIDKELTVELAKNESLRNKLLCPRDQFETDETKNVEQFRGYHLYTTISGEFCLHYLDFKENIQKKCIKIDRLMS